ncbi:DUF1223 domain-containing protein [Trinickia sp. LjRoot230]|uniref:DUF1223 domain-containing protein n=1 Tax=Trinickia sp. LjRoot230 TaxID=3342288 RepID=UPI003ECC7A2B
MKTLKAVIALATYAASVFVYGFAYAGHACSATSGALTAALVELYTSEGCSSCPPADRYLSELNVKPGMGLVIPIGLHVTYWDALGWKDVAAQRLFDERQAALVAAHRGRLVYTPQFFLNGVELRAWQDALPAAIHRANARSAPIVITLHAAAEKSSDTLALDVHIAPHGSARIDGALYLALTESALVSHVVRGENQGATLSHDNVARVLIGPIALDQTQTQARAAGIDIRRRVRLSPQWQRTHLRIVAFVQDARGDIVQALSVGPCESEG